MRILRVLLAAVWLTAAAGGARADDPPSPDALAAADELFAIMSPDMLKQLTAQMTNAFWPHVEQEARAGKVDDATLAEMRRTFEGIQADFLINAMKDAPPIYARHFTAAELRELAAFYRTPTGAKARRELTAVTGEFTTALLPRLQTVQVRIREALNTILHAHGYGR